jgi:lycopene cyclase domain-containing protein
MKWTYLLINLFSLSYPLVKSFEPKLRFHTRWKYYLPSLFLVALFFLVWDYFFIEAAVWRFNTDYILSVYLLNLPLEEILFFIAIPYACTFIYEAVWYFRKSYSYTFPLKPSVYALSALFALLAWLNIDRLYTFYTLFFLSPLLLATVLFLSLRQLQNLWITFAISLFPMAIVNGLLTSLPVLIYNDTQNCGVRIGSIPVEDFGYAAILIFANILFYELFQKNPQRT